MSTNRLIRVPLPATLVQQMDAIIASGDGGYGSREEFVREAIEAAVLETRYGAPEGGDEGQMDWAVPKSVTNDPSKESTASTLQKPLHRTTLLRPASQRLFVEPMVTTKGGGPQFGLHNRDYPSLWAANRLCDLTAEGPVSFDATLKELIGQAWDFGDHLQGLSSEEVRGKPSALFPTNRSKPQSAESAFARFAVGSIWQDEDSAEWVAEGPLFDWGLVGLVEPGDSDPLIGITEKGFELLCDLEGLDVAQPHAEPWAVRFLDHLATSAPSDREGFTVILQGAERMCSRAELIELVRKRWPDWTSTEASTNTSGYVARAREWGLLEPSQAQSKYVLTDFGRRVVEQPS